MFLFERLPSGKPKGKNREPGLQENSVRNFTGRQILYCPFFLAFVELSAAGFRQNGKIIVAARGKRNGFWIFIRRVCRHNFNFKPRGQRADISGARADGLTPRAAGYCAFNGTCDIYTSGVFLSDGPRGA
jgi:hypothetical protein